MRKSFAALQSSKSDGQSKNTAESIDKDLKPMLAVLISLNFKALCNLRPYWGLLDDEKWEKLQTFRM